jgi:hypothetical protein
MEWDTLEHAEVEHTNDWKASVILVAGALIAVEFLFGYFLGVILTFIATATLLLMAARKPEMIHVEIKKTGIRAGTLFYPFRTLDGFSVIEHSEKEHRLLLESNHRLMPLIVIPVADTVDPEDLHEFLSGFIPEKELHESLPHLLMERLGF